MITKGDGALGKIYERLRKRSYRRWTWWSHYDRHEAYVAGVRDALKAVEQDIFTPVKK